MWRLTVKVSTVSKSRCFGICALLLPFLVGAEPARAQDFFGLFRLFSPPAAVPSYQPYDYRSVPSFERPIMRRRPKPVVASDVQKPAPVPKAPGEVTNPVPELLADSTLQPGDMVMFPDGLRVFTGRPGSRHTLADFEPVARAGRTVSPAIRKLLATLPPGSNPAWSAESRGKLAVMSRVGTTGSVRRTAH
jgi:hypothetical protein